MHQKAAVTTKIVRQARAVCISICLDKELCQTLHRV